MKNLNFKSQIIYGFVACITFYVLQVTTVFAQSDRGLLTVEPAFVEVQLKKPQEVKEIKINYFNNSTEPIELELFPLDFKQQDDTGVISFHGQEAGNFSYSLSSFLIFPQRSIEVPAGDRATAIIQVKNRQDLSPGGHYAAVIARQITDKANGTDTTVSPSLSSFILLRKTGGELFNLSLKRLNWPKSPVVFGYPSSIHILFQNEGNVHLVPYGRVDMHDIFGRQLFKGVINTASLRVFPSARRYIASDLRPIQRSLPLSINTVKVNGTDSLKKVSYSYRETFIYVHPLSIIFLIVLLAALYLLKKKLKRNYE